MRISTHALFEKESYRQKKVLTISQDLLFNFKKLDLFKIPS